ncbi:MAG: hypothetical protein QOD98_1170, partial [Nocardioidaceae bacterium]|nr:hypothetical protein [Nocardioidaceae bacterium]
TSAAGGNTPPEAVSIQPDTLYFGHIGYSTPSFEGSLTSPSTGQPDVDYYRIPAQPPGSRIIVSLDPTDIDTDLGLFQLDSTGNATSAATPAKPLDTDPVGEDVPVGSGDEPASVTAEAASAPAGYETVDTSTHPGNGPEEVATDEGGGPYLIKVTGAAASVKPYNLRYTVVDAVPEQRCPALGDAGYPAPGTLPNPAADLPAGTNSLFLVDGTRFHHVYGAAGDSTMADLADFATTATNVQGAIVELDDYQGYVAARNAADANPCSVSKVNAVVKEISKIVEAKLGAAGSPARSSVTSITLVGNDDLLPFARVPDTVQRENEATFEGEERLSQQPGGAPCPAVNPGVMDPCATPLSAAAYDHDLLTDDPYGDFDPIPWLDRFLYVPDVALGRLVETPAQISAALDQYRDPAVDGELDLNTAVTAGYGAWSDGNQRIDDTLGARGMTTTHLTPDTWTKAELLDELFPTGGTTPDVAAIDAHMDPSRLLTGNEETVDTGDYDFDRLTGRLLFTLGCHAGLNLPDTSLGAGADDWVERLAGRAVYVGNTGYGYADGKVVGLTERLLGLYAGRIGGHQSAGQALMYAKQAYLGGLGMYTNYDEKIMMEATFYGLPMYRFAGPVDDTPPTPPATQTDPSTNLVSAGFDLDPTFDTRTVGGETFTTVAGQDPQVVPDRPILPRTSTYATVAGQTAHDALITELTTTVSDTTPGVSTADVGGAPAQEPNDYESMSFPSTFTNVTTYTTPDGPRQDLVLVPAHVQSDTDPVTGQTTGTTELFDHTRAEVFYSNSSDTTRPTFTLPGASRTATSATFTIPVTDTSQVKRVVVLYQTTEGGTWTVLDSADAELTQSGTTWTGTGPAAGLTGTLRWIVQAVDGAGNVAISTNRGAMNKVSAVPPVFDAGANASLEIGGRLTRSVAISDADSTRFTASLDTGEGPEPVDVRDGQALVDTSPVRIGVNTAKLTVCDDGNKCSSDTFTLTVTQNHAPYATATINMSAPTTDQALTVTATSTDPENDATTRRYLWKVNGDPVLDTGPVAATTSTLDLSQPGVADLGDEIMVEVTANDGDLTSAPALLDATVVSTAPTVTAPATRSGQPGSPVSWSGTSADADGSGLVASVDYGDGSAAAGVTLAGDGGYTVSHTYAAEGTFHATVTVTDPQGKQGTAETTVTIQVPNAAPSVDAGAGGTAAEGSTFTSAGTFTDDQPAGATATVNYGDGTGVQPLTLAGGGFSLSHVYADNATRTITVTVTDAGALTGSDTATVTVTNASPVLTVTGPGGSATSGAVVTVAGTFADAGTADTHTVSYAWGDGANGPGQVTEPLGAGTGSVSASHSYAGAGSYPVQVTLLDKDGGTDTRTVTVVVTANPPPPPPPPVHLGDGRGTFTSPKKSSKEAQDAEGKASFQFSAESAVSGGATFTFKKGKVKFTGTSVTAASVAGNTLTLTVAGTNDKKAGFTLVITASDGAKDLIRVRLLKGSKVVYDSQPGKPAAAPPTTKVKGQINVT